jgi:hypothetical protein
MNAMFDDYSFLALAIAIAAFIFARKARNEVKVLQARLDVYETAAPVAAPASVPSRQAPASRVGADDKAPVAQPVVAEADLAREPASRNASAPAGWCGSAA